MEMVRQRKPCSVALIVLPALGLAAFFTTLGCGGGGSSSSQGVPPVVPPVGPVQVEACANGTVASYLNTSCSEGATIYQWQSYTCNSTPSSICTALGTNGSNVNIQLDPKGPYTLLMGRTTLWNVTAGQSVDVVISGTVYGSMSNGNWPHFNGLNGQTGDGTEENITTVGCAASGNCLDANNGVSDILCSAGGPPANCTDQSTIGPYSKGRATFNAAPSTDPYTLTIEIKLNGNSGTATLYSVGTHLIPAGVSGGGN